MTESADLALVAVRLTVVYAPVVRGMVGRPCPPVTMDIPGTEWADDWTTPNSAEVLERVRSKLLEAPPEQGGS